MGSYWDVWSRHIFSCVSSYYKGKYILCVIYRRVVAANISQFQQKCLQSENSVNISSSEVLTNSVSNLMICEYRIDMIHLKTIIMKKKLTWSPLYLTLFIFFLSVAGLAPFPPKKNLAGVPLRWFNLNPTHLPQKWPDTLFLQEANHVSDIFYFIKWNNSIKVIFIYQHVN